MELAINKLNKVFENLIRLGVMSILMVNDWVDFSTLKEMLNITDGNLASHIKALENEQYIEIKKRFIGKKPNTSYRVTINGRNAFNDHLNILENIINQKK
jgi:DNA-binding MarR family transcriptional regulator